MTTVPPGHRKAFLAHVAPFALFILGFALIQLIESMAGKTDLLMIKEPQYWVFPLQTVVCATALIYFWKTYDFGPQGGVLLAMGVGLVVFAIWVSPQLLFRQPPRLEGFDPQVFVGDPTVYWATVSARFARLVIVVPLIEEIFWRGFLQRYLIEERFETVPLGKYTHLSFWGVVLGFTFIHAPVDYPAAAITGAIYGWLTVSTRSIIAPIVAHAVTNFALGIYIMKTSQWGFW
jgi:CAAX prenyl protease-like protein